MLLPFPAIDAAFKASTPRDVAILFLIEDSTQMGTLWPRLRDFYLPKVLTAIKDANPSGSIQVLWMSTSQLSVIDLASGSSGRRSKRWTDIPALNFIQDPNNKVSPVAITRAVDALALAFGRTQAVRHLMVIAASDPGGESAPRPYTTLPWIPVVHKLQQEDTRIHLIVRSQHNMDGLTSFFWETAKKDPARPTVTDDTHYVFYLRNEADHAAQSAPTSPQTSATSSTSTSSKAASTSNANKPSLVFQLQKLNGMEKKRRSRSRRDPLTAARPGVPYPKPHTEMGRSVDVATSRTSSPTRSRRSGRTIDEVVGSVYDVQSRSTSSEDTTSYAATTSPTRSLSPSSPSYSTTNSLTSSPLLGSPVQWPLRGLPSPSATTWATTPVAYDQYLRTPTNTIAESTFGPSAYHGAASNYRAMMPGPIRSHFPPGHHTNPRRFQSQTLDGDYSETPPWHHAQRETSGVDHSYSHVQPHILSVPDNPNVHREEAPADSAYTAHHNNYAEVVNEGPTFYSEHDNGSGYCYPPDGYERPDVDHPTYSLPMNSSSSSLHPPPVSTFFR